MKAVDAIMERVYPVASNVEQWETESGHRDEFGPDSYGDYLATSNEIFSVVQFRARQFGSLPLRLYDGDSSEKTEVTDGPEADLLRRVNPHWTRARLMRQTEMSMGVWGEAFWAVQRDRPGGQPKEIWWLKPSRVHPVPHRNDWLSGYLYEARDGTRVPFRTDEIVWFRYPNPLDEFAGMSPLAAARLAADVASASMKSNRNLFTQGMQLGGTISPAKDKVKFSADQADDLEKLLNRRFTGADKAHKWAVLRFEAAFNEWGVTPRDAEFIDGLNLTFRQVCRVYGVPPPLLFDLEHATLANVRELQKIFWEHAGLPEANFYAYDIEEQLLPMFGERRQVKHVAWDFSTVPALQEAATAVWDRERQQIDSGALTINEWRKSKGMPAVAWGDVFWAPVNKAPVDTATVVEANAGPVDEGREKAKFGLDLAALISAELHDLIGANGHV